MNPIFPNKNIPAIIEQVQEFSWEEAISEGLEIREQKDNCQWGLGDLALKVEKNYGEDSLSKFSHSIGIDTGSLMVYRWTANKIPVEMRDRLLSFEHHKIIAGCKDREKWIKQASDNSWSTSQLHKAIEESGDKHEKTEEKLETEKIITELREKILPNQFPEKEFVESDNYLQGEIKTTQGEYYGVRRDDEFNTNNIFKIEIIFGQNRNGRVELGWLYRNYQKLIIINDKAGQYGIIASKTLYNALYSKEITFIDIELGGYDHLGLEHKEKLVLTCSINDLIDKQILQIYTI